MVVFNASIVKVILLEKLVTFGMHEVDISENEIIPHAMPNLTNEENWAARERLRRVEFLLWWRGWVGRNDLVELFGISPAQASGDLQRYAGINPGAMIYQTSRKRYEADRSMKCELHTPSFDEAVRSLLGGGPPIDSFGGRGGEGDPRLSVVNLPTRAVIALSGRMVLMALIEKRTVEVLYASVSSGKEEWRTLAPHGLAWDGQRWHVRAWCHTREGWRDFVLGRMKMAKWPGESAGTLPEDVDWANIETLVLRVNPDLSEEQRAALRLDYNLSGETLELRVRRAMKPYLLAAMFIQEPGMKELPRHFVLAE